jgi:propanediol dehydratase small subunit
MNTDDDLTVQAAIDDKLGLRRLRMDPAALDYQATVAASGGNPQLAENFRRAAELAVVDDDDVMALYEALRPNRSTATELDELAARLQEHGAARCANLVREASAAYARRGLLL